MKLWVENSRKEDTNSFQVWRIKFYESVVFFNFFFVWVTDCNRTFVLLPNYAPVFPEDKKVTHSLLDVFRICNFEFFYSTVVDFSRMSHKVMIFLLFYYWAWNYCIIRVQLMTAGNVENMQFIQFGTISPLISS